MTVGALRRGEPQVLADLLAAYGREIQGVAYLKLRNRADAEDVLMDTLLTALDRGSSLRDRQQCASGFSTSRRTAQPTSFRKSEEFWILGVEGNRLMIAAEWSFGSPTADVAQPVGNPRLHPHRAMRLPHDLAPQAAWPTLLSDPSV